MTTLTTVPGYHAGIARDTAGNLYLSAVGDHIVRKITPAGVVTIFGVAGSPGQVDGPPDVARFNGPHGMTADDSGNVYVTDVGTCTIRKITPQETVITFAGTGSCLSTIDGTGTAAGFAKPWAITTDGLGTLFVGDGDGGSGSIRKVTAAAEVTTVAPCCAGGREHFLAADKHGRLYFGGWATVRMLWSPIADAAQIDRTVGAIGTKVQLGTSPSTATKHRWAVTRRPSGSVAALSSHDARDPTFTPDIAGLFTFRLTAETAAGGNTSFVSLLVQPAPTVTELKSAPSPSLVGDSVTLTAKVATGATGTVTFRDAAVVLATKSLIDGSATHTVASLAAGAHAMTASYSGDDAFKSSTSATLTHRVLQPVSITLTSSPNPSPEGTPVTLTAALSSGATGTVTFRDGDRVLGTATVSGSRASLITAFLQPGSYALSAVYGGDAAFAAGTSSVLTQVVHTPAAIPTASPWALLLIAASIAGAALTRLGR